MNMDWFKKSAGDAKLQQDFQIEFILKPSYRA